MPQITIQNQVISFPDSGSSPDWSVAIIQFAQAVQNALAVSIGPYDVDSQSMVIDSYNSSSNINIPPLLFSPSIVRAAYINYSVFRQTNSANASEAGDLIILYNPNNPTNQKWTITQGNITGVGGKIAFNITDLGQLQFTTTALAGTGHSGKIGFYAKVIQQ